MCYFQVYDRLNAVGVSLSYCRAIEITRMIGGHFSDILEKAARNGRRLRIIGDNLNFAVGVAQERFADHKHMVHMFASAILISDNYFLDKPIVPEIPLDALSINDITLSNTEYQVVRRDCAVIIGSVISQRIPQLGFIADSLPADISGPDADTFRVKTDVVPLPVINANEMYYADDIKILDHYEDIIRGLMNKGALSDNIKLHIGGDQLTRERFSKAKLLRIGNANPHERFAHLGPVTFEFFHLGMNYMDKILFGKLYKADGSLDIGTMKAEQERILRHSVDPNVMEAYDANKDFIMSFMNAFIVEAALSFFGMDDLNAAPTQHIPPVFNNADDQREWVYEALGELVDRYVFPGWSGHVPDIVNLGNNNFNNTCITCIV